jgi:hypothetical protein
MTRDEVIAILQYRCGDRDDLAVKIQAEMKHVQTQILEEHAWLPWFCEVELPATNLLAGAESIPVPSGFLREIEDERIWLVRADGSKTELKKYESGQLRKRYAEQGEPDAYALLADTIIFRPVPELDYTLEWRYYGAQVDMAAANVETPWLKYAADVTLGELGVVIAGRHMQNAALETRFRQDATSAWENLYRKHEARADVNRDPYMGG